MSKKEILAYAITHAPRGQKGGPYEAIGGDMGDACGRLSASLRWPVDNPVNTPGEVLKEAQEFLTEEIAPKVPHARVIRIVRKVRPSEASAVDVLRQLAAHLDKWSDDSLPVSRLMSRAVLTASGPDPMPVVRAAVAWGIACERYGGRPLDLELKTLAAVATPEDLERAERELAEVRELQRSDERDGNVGFSLTCWVESILEQLNIARINRTELGKAAGRYARERDEAKELARVLEVERDTLRAELARLTASGEGTNAATETQLREQSDFDAGVAHERARQHPAKDRATDEELLATYAAAFDAAEANAREAGVLAVAARVRQERCLVARAVADPLLDSVSVGAVMGGRIRVLVVRRVDSLANTLGEPVEVYCERADVPETLARLLGEVSRG